MDKVTLLKNYGDTKVKEISGILHNYTKHGTVNEAMQLEDLIRKIGNLKLSIAMPQLNDILEFY